ncbi:MAG: Gfo/Idh/MocA family oxidoreductase [Terrimicrobiaceae bacterium]|nr:Gfo/Idh/MocA family oxidoreductase [Terrimicrobiaceae bacterium]
MKPIGFGVIGLGWPGQQHSHAISHVPGARLVAACDIEVSRREAYAAQFPGVRLFAGHEALLEDPEVEVVIIGLPNFLHAPVTLDAFAAGRHVLCEKPPTLNVAEMEEIQRESRRRKRVYAFGRQFRFTSDILEAKQAVASGQLGSVYLAKGRWTRLRGAPLGIGGWFIDKARAGGGAIIDLGIHALDNAWYLCGCPKPASVTASTGRYFLGESDGDVEDTGLAFLRFDGGLVITLEIAWAMNMSDEAAKPVDWAGAESIQTLLHGTSASLQVSPPALFRAEGNRLARDTLAAGPSRSDAYEALPYPIPGFARQIEDVARAVRDGTPPTNHVDHALELMKMLAGIYESGRSRSEVRFTAAPPPVPVDDLSL